MSVYAIGDLHLSMSEAVDKPMDMFGPAWQNHQARLEENWRKVITEDDTVIIPGDISWALYLKDAMADLAWIDSLPGTKILLRGNHDPWWSSMNKMRGLFDSIKFIQNDAYRGKGFVVFGSRGWICPGDKMFKAEDEHIYQRELIRMNMAKECALKLVAEAKAEGENPTVIAATHFPPMNDKKQENEITAMFREADVLYAIYGHLHGEYVFPNGPSGILNAIEYRNVSLDRLDCVPTVLITN